MWVLLNVYPDEANAKMAKGLLDANNIKSVISPGGGNRTIFFSPITGLDPRCQLFVRDVDVEKAKEILGTNN